MTAYNQEMFQKIAGALHNDNTSQAFKHFLKMKEGNTYIVRLVPNIESPEKSIFHYFSHGWESKSTGQYVGAVSPTTWGERDPIPEARFKIIKGKSSSEDEKEEAKMLTRRENWMVNVYVVDDPTEPENNGTVKVLKYGRQLDKIITSAIEGDDKDEFGPKIFDLTGDGCNLKIKVEEQGGFNTYSSSRFTSPSKIKGLKDEDIPKIYESVHDLESIYPVKSYDELKEMLDEHFFCKDSNPDVSEEDVNKTVPVSDNVQTVDNVVSDNIDSTSVVSDEKVQEMLKGLDL